MMSIFFQEQQNHPLKTADDIMTEKQTGSSGSFSGHRVTVLWWEMAEEVMSHLIPDLQNRKKASQYQLGIGSRRKRKRGRSRRERKEIAGLRGRSRHSRQMVKKEGEKRKIK